MLNMIILLLCIVNLILLLVSIFFIKNSKVNSYKLEKIIRDEMEKCREGDNRNFKDSREEISGTLRSFNESMISNMTHMSVIQKNQMDEFKASNEESLQKMRDTIEKRLQLIQEDNSSKLEKMRETVNEKLDKTLESRLGNSFKIVSDNLELVHKEIGEMKVLADDVGDLKKVLSNVKVRGTWGEVELGSLLDQIFSPQQYGKNVATKKGSREVVEYALKIPSKDSNDDFIWLPIDSKFPIEDYQRLLNAQEKADTALIEEYGKKIEDRIKMEAKDIKEKYIAPPSSTDFGIMFLPIEGLYAEVLRRDGLCETLQRKYRVIVTGPTTLAALLNSLQIGFRTIAIEKRSDDVWQLLGTIKTEFENFGEALDKTQKKIQEASNSIENAARRTRVIERKLNKVQELPE